MFTLQTTAPILLIVLVLFGTMYRYAFKRWSTSRRDHNKLEAESSSA